MKRLIREKKSHKNKVLPPERHFGFQVKDEKLANLKKKNCFLRTFAMAMLEKCTENEWSQLKRYQNSCCNCSWMIQQNQYWNRLKHNTADYVCTNSTLFSIIRMICSWVWHSSIKERNITEKKNVSQFSKHFAEWASRTE